MSLDAGTKLGPYVVVAHVAAGGMGEVYRARDTRLDRTVAIKTLPAKFSASAELKQRFEREARAISSLSHPNICALFDVGHEHGISYLVMEYLDGESLAGRLARGPLPVHDAIRYAIEIGSALDRAHRSNIIHRDLKPGNVMLTKSGAKLVDFGLARAAAAPAVDPDSATALLTSAEPLTSRGAVVGTVPYMAPEQLASGTSDVRSDIFAFGAILYEMLSGARPFPGSTTAHTIASIISSEPPPLIQVRPDVPAALADIVHGALAKDPDERWQSAHDVVLQLKSLSIRAEEREVAADGAPASKRLMQPGWIAAAISTMVAVALAALLWRSRGDAPPVLRASIEPPGGRAALGAVISEDGTTVLMLARDAAGKTSAWLRGIGDTSWRELQNVRSPGTVTWSPDGKEVAYVSEGKLWRRSLDAERSDVICDAAAGVAGDWLEDGTILFTPNFGSPLMKVSVSGGTPAPVLDPPSKYGQSFYASPQLLEDGRLLFFARKSMGVDSAIYVSDPKPGAPRKKLLEADGFVGLRSGHLLYARDSALMAAPFDVEREEVTGPPSKIVEHVGFESGSSIVFASAGANGALIFNIREDDVQQLVELDDRGKELRTIGSAFPMMFLSRSPDRRRMAVTGIERDASIALSNIDLTRGVVSPIVRDRAPKMWPSWAPDNHTLFYTADRHGYFDIFRRDADGNEGDELVLSSPADKAILAATSRDEVVYRVSPDPQRRIFAYDAKTKSNRVLGLRGRITDLAFHPDGRSVAILALDASGITEDLFLASYPDGKYQVQVSAGGASAPEFSSDGRKLYYLAREDKSVRELTLQEENGRLTVAAERTLFTLDAELVGSTDGKRFLAVRTKSAAPRWPYYVSDWRTSLK